MISVTCPVCAMTSWHPKDVEYGYCGNCHDFTSAPFGTDPAPREDRPPMPDSPEPYPPDDTGSVNPAALPDARRRADAAVASIADWQPVGITEWPADLVDAAPITAHQAQGDVMVLPWPPSTVPSWRAAEVDAAKDVPAAGRPVDPDGSHVLIPDDPDAPGPVRYHPTGKGYTLGTLYVPLGSAARLSHREHADLLIGPGVYVLRQQRRWDPRGAAAAKD